MPRQSDLGASAGPLRPRDRRPHPARSAQPSAELFRRSLAESAPQPPEKSRSQPLPASFPASARSNDDKKDSRRPNSRSGFGGTGVTRTCGGVAINTQRSTPNTQRPIQNPGGVALTSQAASEENHLPTLNAQRPTFKLERFFVMLLHARIKKAYSSLWRLRRSRLNR